MIYLVTTNLSSIGIATHLDLATTNECLAYLAKEMLDRNKIEGSLDSNGVTQIDYYNTESELRDLLNKKENGRMAGLSWGEVTAYLHNKISLRVFVSKTGQLGFNTYNKNFVRLINVNSVVPALILEGEHDWIADKLASLFQQFNQYSSLNLEHDNLNSLLMEIARNGGGCNMYAIIEKVTMFGQSEYSLVILTDNKELAHFIMNRNHINGLDKPDMILLETPKGLTIQEIHDFIRSKYHITGNVYQDAYTQRNREYIKLIIDYDKVASILEIKTSLSTQYVTSTNFLALEVKQKDFCTVLSQLTNLIDNYSGLNLSKVTWNGILEEHLPDFDSIQKFIFMEE